jgi:hypothetical protein
LQRIKALVCILKAIQQFINTHLFWEKDNMVTAIVFAPVACQDASFAFHSLEQTGTRKGSKNVECSILNSCIFQKVNRILEYVRRIRIKPKDDPGLDSDAMAMNPLD